MATKVKMMKFLQEVRGFAEMGRLAPPPKPAALFLMQLRAHVRETSTSRRRLVISIDLKDNPDIPDPVKITHVTPARSE
jgi:hypothetical protein